MEGKSETFMFWTSCPFSVVLDIYHAVMKKLSNTEGKLMDCYYSTW